MSDQSDCKTKREREISKDTSMSMDGYLFKDGIMMFSIHVGFM